MIEFNDALIGAVTIRLRVKKTRVYDLSGAGWEKDADCALAADLIERLYAAWIVADEDAKLSKEFLAVADTRLAAADEAVAPLLSALRGIFAVTDRNHVAWDTAHAAIDAAEKYQPR